MAIQGTILLLENEINQTFQRLTYNLWRIKDCPSLNKFIPLCQVMTQPCYYHRHKVFFFHGEVYTLLS